MSAFLVGQTACVADESGVRNEISGMVSGHAVQAGRIDQVVIRSSVRATALPLRVSADGLVLDEGDLRVVADDLAVVIRAQWQDEVARRELNDPYPLPVRWRPAEAHLFADWADLVRLATSGAGWSPVQGGSVWAASVAELAGEGGELAGVWEKVPTGRLVVLGEPGAGKTMLLVRLVLDLLAVGRREAGTAVPVLVSVASWDPARQDLHSWFAERLALDHPALGRRRVTVVGGTRASTVARALLDHGLIMMVLDGLDELPGPVRALAISGINQVIRAGQSLIVSSRADAYREAVRPPRGVEVTLTGAAGIQVCPLDSSEVVAYLRASAGGPAGERRWDLVAAMLTAPPGSNAVRQAMVTPLMATLARVIYNPRPGESTGSLPDPSELLALPSRRDVELHLFDGFVPAAYRPHPTRRRRWDATSARKWLGYLAHHLERDHQGAPDIAWWRLHIRRPARRASMMLVLGSGCAVTVGAGLAMGLVFSGFSSPDTEVIGGPRVAAFTALAYGLIYWFTGRFNAALTAALIVAVVSGPAVIFGGPDPDLGHRGLLSIVLAAGLAAGLAHPLKQGAPSGMKAGLLRGSLVGGLA